jgi:hypothetical protein
MNQFPAWGGEAVTAEDSGQPPRPPRIVAPPTPPVVVNEIAVPVSEDAKYVTSQQIAPVVMGLIRGVQMAVYGAIGGLLTGLQMGSRSWPDLAWGALIGACLGFLGRVGEAVINDQPRTASVTEKV